MNWVYISCCTSIHQSRMAAEAGFDRVVLSASELVRTPEHALRSLAGDLRRWGLECRSMNDFCSQNLKLCGPEYRLDRVVEYVKQLAPRAAMLGITQVGVGAPGARMLPVGYSKGRAEAQLRECIERAAEVCRPYGLRILLEPICKQMTNFLNRTAEVFHLVEAWGDLGMVYDIYHAWMMREPPTALLPAVEKIEMVHIAHAEHGRSIPTRDTAPQYIPYAAALLNGGYRGEIAVECSLDGVNQLRMTECCRVVREMFQTVRRPCREDALQNLLESG